MTTPNLAEFRKLAQTRRVIPVFRKLLADGETALGLYRKLANERAGTFLLESAEHGRSWSRYSFVGVASSAMLSERDGQALWSGKVPQGVPESGDPISALRETLDVLYTSGVNEGITTDELPPLTGGVVGYLGYDIVRRLEKLPNDTIDLLQLPELAMLVATDLAVLDHKDGTVTLIANAINYDNSDERVDEAWADAERRLAQMELSLSGQAPASVASFDRSAKAEFTRETQSKDYQAAVLIAQERIRAGDAFQIVLSQRFATSCQASALDVYRVLRATNPSPYMFLFRIPELTGPGEALGTKVAFDIVGSGSISHIAQW